MFTAIFGSGSISLFIWLALPKFSDCAPAQPTITPPPSFPDLEPRADAANQCWTSWSSYISASLSTDTYAIENFPYTDITLAQYVSTYYDVETVNYDTIAWTTLCDGRTREVSSQPTTTFPTSSTTYYNYATWTRSDIPRTNIIPKCTYSRRSPQCTKLWQSWSSSTSSLTSILATATETPYTSASSALYALKNYAIPPCKEPEWSCPVAPDMKECTVGVDQTGTMYYWPITTISGDFCAQNGTTLTPSPTKKNHPNTVVYHGETFTSPSVYLVFPSATAYYHSAGVGRFTSSGFCGPTIKDITLTLPPSSISSVGFKDPQSASQVNWGDFNTVIQDSWVNACPYWLGCSGWVRRNITNYEPFIQIPHDILKEAKRDWKNCTGWGYVQPKLVRLGEKMTTEGGWHQGVLETVTAEPTSTVDLGLPKMTDAFDAPAPTGV